MVPGTRWSPTPAMGSELETLRAVPPRPERREPQPRAWLPPPDSITGSTRLRLDGKEAIECCLIAVEGFDPRNQGSSFVSGHRDQENYPKIVLLAFALKMNARKPGDVVNPGHPVLPFEDINRVFC